MFRGAHYQRTQLDSKYDVIVIGSGLGGLTVASLLSQIGKKVLVLEQHYVLGGFTQTFSRQGKFRWDVGVHYVCEAHIENSMSRRAFDWISQKRLKWHETDPVYDRVIVQGRQFDYVKGRRTLKEGLKREFPKEGAAIDHYFNLLFEVQKATSGYFMSKGFSDFNPIQLVLKKGKRKFEELSQRSLKQVLDELFQDPDLKAVLAAQCGDYGLPPEKGSFAMHALVTLGYSKGAAFPVGGSDAFADSIGSVIAENGGTLVVKARVSEILIKGNRAYGVKMVDGKEILADQIVSGAGVFNTFNSLLPSHLVKHHQLDKKVSKMERSCAHIALHIGFKGSNTQLNLPGRNYWIYPSNQLDEAVKGFYQDMNAELPGVFVNFPSAKDPLWHDSYPETSTAVLIALASFRTFEKWKDKKWKKRGEDYEALKKQFENRLLEIFQKHFPHLVQHIAYTELSTPLSTRTFVSHEEGEIYGAAFGTRRFKDHQFKPRTPINGLYLTGVDVLTDGITGALYSGYLCAFTMEPIRTLGFFAKSTFT